MNIIEKRKGQLKGFGLIILVVSALALLGGIIMAVLSAGDKINVLLLVFGIILACLGVAGVVCGVVFTWVSGAVKATNGSIAEDNLGIGTVNMHKCSNCGVEIPQDKTICDKCEENLKP